MVEQPKTVAQWLTINVPDPADQINFKHMANTMRTAWHNNELTIHVLFQNLVAKRERIFNDAIIEITPEYEDVLLGTDHRMEQFVFIAGDIPTNMGKHPKVTPESMMEAVAWSLELPLEDKMKLRREVILNNTMAMHDAYYSNRLALMEPYLDNPHVKFRNIDDKDFAADMMGLKDFVPIGQRSLAERDAILDTMSFRNQYKALLKVIDSHGYQDELDRRMNAHSQLSELSTIVPSYFKGVSEDFNSILYGKPESVRYLGLSSPFEIPKGRTHQIYSLFEKENEMDKRRTFDQQLDDLLDTDQEETAYKKWKEEQVNEITLPTPEEIAKDERNKIVLPDIEELVEDEREKLVLPDIDEEDLIFRDALAKADDFFDDDFDADNAKDYLEDENEDDVEFGI